VSALSASVPVPFPATSLPIAAESNALDIRNVTASLRSARRFDTKSGRSRRLCAVCSDDANNVWFYHQRRSCLSTYQISKTGHDHIFHFLNDGIASLVYRGSVSLDKVERHER
jgi:hypothetical protein